MKEGSLLGYDLGLVTSFFVYKLSSSAKTWPLIGGSPKKQAGGIN
jgi:hypothetical protein